MEEIVKYIFEAGMLKRTARSGWWAEKIKNPESVADHVCRSAILAFVLAKMEGMDDKTARKICTAAVFHDMHETRLGDMNKITARYIPIDKELERKIENEQVQKMPQDLRKSLLGVFELSEKEEIVLKDADFLECAFTAKEYGDIGHSGARIWIENTKKRVKTESAKKLLGQIEKQDSNSWWKGLKKIE